jgi:hypothetical protein
MLATVAPALAAADALAGQPRGRCQVNYTSPLILIFNHDHIQDARTVARLLRLRSLLRAEDGDTDAALADCRALLNTARPLAEEPSTNHFLVAVATRLTASSQVQRALAQGQPNRGALTALQSRLDEESDHPSLLTALRGERAELEDTIRCLAGRRLDTAEVEKGIQMFDRPKPLTGYETIDAWIHRLQGGRLESEERHGLFPLPDGAHRGCQTHAGRSASAIR